jgi:hypothetical protein
MVKDCVSYIAYKLQKIAEKLTDITMRLISLENFLFGVESLGDNIWTACRPRCGAQQELFEG